MIIAMLKEDTQGLATDFKLKFVWQAISDYKMYVQIGIYIGEYSLVLQLLPLPSIDDRSAGLLIPIYAISLFLPTIINKLGRRLYIAHRSV